MIEQLMPYFKEKKFMIEELFLGDIILTRYLDESKNTSPGVWNHSAIVTQSGIVESLKEEGVVLQPDAYKYVGDLDHYVLIRPSSYAGQEAGMFAPSLVGSKYKAMSSIVRNIRPWRISVGINCVMVVRISYKHALGYDPKWTTPDGILEDAKNPMNTNFTLRGIGGKGEPKASYLDILDQRYNKRL